MKDFVSLLNDDNLSVICRLISGRRFKELYKKKPNEYQKIKQGIRSGSLPDEEACTLAKENVSAIFVRSYINRWINDHLNDILKHKKSLMNEGNPQEAALIDSLAQSVFYENIGIYFVLLEEMVSEKYIALIEYSIGVINEQKKATMVVEQKEDSEKNYEQQFGALRSTYEKENNSLRESIIETQKLLSRTESDLNEIKEEQLTLKAELDRYYELSQCAAITEKLIPAEGFTYISLCKTYTDTKGRKRLQRIADVKDFLISESFLNDYPSEMNLFRNLNDSFEDGCFGIWDWKVSPREADPTKNYIESSIHTGVFPIEVIISDSQSITELIELLKSGIGIRDKVAHMIIAFFNGYVYEGLYCDVHSVVLQSGKLSFKSEILKVPVYEFRESDIIITEDLTFLRLLNPGLPIKMEYVKDPLEIVRDLIVTKLGTWSIMKQQGYTRKEYGKIKDYISNLPTKKLHEEISAVCNCDEETARKMIEEFRTHAENYITGNSFENSIVVQIVSNSDDLRRICIEKYRSEWELQNQELLAEKDKNQNVIVQKKKEVEQLEMNIVTLQEKIAVQEKLALEVEEKVLIKIEQARSNAAEFIAENAFIHPNTLEQNVAIPKAINDTAAPISFHDGIASNTINLEIISNWNELLSFLQGELCEAGVSEEFSMGVSAFLYAAFVNRTPVLLAGPSGIEIAKAFSLVLFGCTPAVLQCSHDQATSSFEQCETSQSEIVVIEQAFQHEGYNSVIRLLAERRKFYIVVHPFAEDLAIEPRGLVNYCIPLLTEIFIDKQPSRDYIGGCMADAFVSFSSNTYSRSYDKLLRTLKLHSLARANIQKVISDMHGLLQENSVDSDYLLLLYPLAYVVGGVEDLLEYMDKASDKIKPSSKTQELIKSFTGEKR